MDDSILFEIYKTYFSKIIKTLNFDINNRFRRAEGIISEKEEDELLY